MGSRGREFNIWTLLEDYLLERGPFTWYNFVRSLGHLVFQRWRSRNVPEQTTFQQIFILDSVSVLQPGHDLLRAPPLRQGRPYVDSGGVTGAPWCPTEKTSRDETFL